MIGVESGSPEMLERIKKDITIPQVFESAIKCSRHGIGAILNFIVGFPGETAESIQQTLDVAARLRAISPDFEVSVFYFRPYPGNPIAEELLKSGYEFPSTLEGWADFDYVGGRENGSPTSSGNTSNGSSSISATPSVTTVIRRDGLCTL